MALLTPPTLTGNLELDVPAIQRYLYDLTQSFTILVTDAPDSGWSSVGTGSTKTLNASEPLANTQDVLATLIQVLISKGVLGA